MKKLYAFAAAALATVSMNAQLYVCGAGDGLAWTPEDPMVVELADGAYTFEITNLTQFKISTAMGTWDDFNAACYVANVTKDLLGTPVELVPGDANIGTPWKGDYKVVVAGDMSTITLTTDTPEPTGPVSIYLRGGMNNWGNDGLTDQWKFTSENGKDFEFVCEGETVIPAGVEFKIADADWDKINYGGGLIDCNEPMEWYYNGDNSSLAEDFEGTITFTLPEVEKDPMEVLFTKGAGVNDVAVDANAPAEYFNLQGVRVANPESGLYIVRKGGNVSKVLVK